MTTSEKREYWVTKVREAQSFSGSVKAFCEQQGISLATFGYWKAKLKSQPLTRMSVQPSPFVRVEIERPKSTLPDPKWVAEILVHLSRGLE